ncbi:hypothetical protein RUM43_000258 [Polyplax serrata]|uniref:Uncharacterized protein n=1 Tax=Polyplax serrata TaxID=468196 RepID=A0AAN8SC47_POLSC
MRATLNILFISVKYTRSYLRSLGVRPGRQAVELGRRHHGCGRGGSVTTNEDLYKNHGKMLHHGTDKDKEKEQVTTGKDSQKILFQRNKAMQLDARKEL